MRPNQLPSPSAPRASRITSWRRKDSNKPPKRFGDDVQVETQGSVGTRNTPSEDAIAAAGVVIIAADTRVDTARFADKPIYETATEPAIRDGVTVIKAALASAVTAARSGALGASTPQ